MPRSTSPPRALREALSRAGGDWTHFVHPRGHVISYRRGWRALAQKETHGKGR